MKKAQREMRPGYMAEGLQNLCSFLGSPKIIAEIGCYAGESTAIMLEALKPDLLVAVDLWTGGWNSKDCLSNDSLDAWPMAEDCFNENVMGYNVAKIKMASVDAAKLFADHAFDFIYIDADHELESVAADIAAWRPKVKPGGFIGGHDYGPACPFGGVVRAVNDVFSEVRTFGDSSWLKQLS